MSQFDELAPQQLFKALESATTTTSLPKLATLLDAVRFNEDGLIPAIAQQHDTGEVLMMAWMNREALELNRLAISLPPWPSAKASTLSAKRLSFRAYVKHADP